MRFVIVTGMSGSGKSSVMKILEDDAVVFTAYVDSIDGGFQRGN